MKLPNGLPENLKNKAISLQDVGVPGVAWRLSDIEEVIAWIDKQADPVILGGDLYLYIQNKDVVYPMRENWYFMPKKDASDHKESVKKALEFIDSYKTDPLNLEIIVDLVVQ